MTLLQMSAAGAVMICVITLIRALAMNRVPKRTFLVLWGVALARLLIPFTLLSGMSIYSLLGRLRQGTAPVAANSPVVGIPAVPAERAAAALPQPGTASTAAIPVWGIIWAAGMLLCAAVFAVTYWKCCREFRMSLPVEHEAARRWLQEHVLRRTIFIRQSDRVSSPLTFGVVRPVILMPKNTDWENGTTLQYVLEHEFVHIRRFDILTKLLLIAAVCVHWFNPLVWVMYILANRDIELSCDEAVVRHFGNGTRASYANVLISMEEARSGLAPLCSHFSKNAIEERITAIMKLPKTTIASLAVAAALVAGTVSVFATSAKPETAGTSPAETTKEEEDIISYLDPADGKNYYSFDDGKTFEPLTDAQFEQLYPTPDIEWWTYDEYKAWLESEKVQLQSMLGERGSVNGGKEFVWTQEKIDETIAMYEEILQEIKNGVLYSKTVDGQETETMIVSYDSAQAMHTSTDAK